MPGASTTTATDPRQESASELTREAFILGFNIIKDISEASELLSPLKATCALILRGLETTRVSWNPACDGTVDRSRR